MKVRDRILVITDLMLGALHADATMTGEEERAVRELLAKLLLVTPEALPEPVDQRIRSFSLATFDIERAASEFLRDPPMRKRRLLELIAALTDRDGTDLSEDEYLRDLAQCLGMSQEDCRGIVLDYEIEQLRQGFDAIRAGESQPGATHDAVPRWRRNGPRARLDTKRKAQPVQQPQGRKQQRSLGTIAVPLARASDDRPRSVPPPIPEAARRRSTGG